MSMTNTPAKKTAASAKNSESDETTVKESGHDRLDRIADSVGYSAEGTAVRELVEFVRENTASSKLGKRTKSEGEEGDDDDES